MNLDPGTSRYGVLISGNEIMRHPGFVGTHVADVCTIVKRINKTINEITNGVPIKSPFLNIYINRVSHMRCAVLAKKLYFISCCGHWSWWTYSVVEGSW